MTADSSDVAAAAAAFEAGTADSAAYHSTAGDHAGAGEAVSLPAAGDRHGRGFDLAEVDSLPAGSALRRPY